MKQVTIRKISDRGIRKAKEMAQDRGTSLNAILAEALEKGLGVQGAKASNGLDRFAADSDFGPDWEGYLERDLQRIDEELWR